MSSIINKGWFYFIVLFMLETVVLAPCFAQSKIWELSRDNSRIQFSIEYLMFRKIKGEFREYDATFLSENPDFSDADVEINIYTHSIETGNEKRDTDLKSESLFHVNMYPEMNFHGKQIVLVKENIYKISGDLRIKDIIRSVILDARIQGVSKAEDGQLTIKWHITAIIKRSDFDLKLSKFKELLADDNVKIDIQVEFILPGRDMSY